MPGDGLIEPCNLFFGVAAGVAFDEIDGCIEVGIAVEIIKQLLVTYCIERHQIAVLN